MASGVIGCGLFFYIYDDDTENSYFDPFVISFRNMASCGACVTTPGENETPVLVSFDVLSPVGLLNILYTKISFRRWGLRLGVKIQMLGRKVAAMGITPRNVRFGTMHPDNYSSKQASHLWTKSIGLSLRIDASCP